MLFKPARKIAAAAAVALAAGTVGALTAPATAVTPTLDYTCEAPGGPYTFKVVADTTLVWVASAVVTALALAGFLLSRTVGLPQIGDDIGNWTEPLGFPAVGAEALVVVLAGLVVGPHHTRKRRRS